MIIIIIIIIIIVIQIHFQLQFTIKSVGSLCFFLSYSSYSVVVFPFVAKKISL